MGAVEGAEKQQGMGAKVAGIAVGIITILSSLTASSPSSLLYFLLFKLRR